MHVDTDLSAYLDAELAPADRARVEAHLDTCDRCRSRLGELRATVSLISALPTPRASRSLVPHLVERFNWLRPLRSFSAVASGAFLFLFLATAVARSGSGLGGGPTSPFGGTAAAPAGAPPAATAAPERAATAAATTAASPRQLGPAAVPAPAATAAADNAQPTAGASPAPQLAVQPTPSPKAAQEAAPTARTDIGTRGPPEVARAAGPREVARTTTSPLSDPMLWLGLAVIAAVIAIGAHWRLRRI